MVRSGIFASLLLAATLACAQDVDHGGVRPIGYTDVGAALADLRGNPEVQEFEMDGWTWMVLSEGEGRLAMWSFAPFAHPAYPAAVKRTLLEQDGALVLETRTLCQASLAACQSMLTETEAASDLMKQRFAEAIIEQARADQERRRQQQKYQERLKRHAEMLQARPRP